jgi:hypothetical protein
MRTAASPRPSALLEPRASRPAVRDIGVAVAGLGRPRRCDERSEISWRRFSTVSCRPSRTRHLGGVVHQNRRRHPPLAAATRPDFTGASSAPAVTQHSRRAAAPRPGKDIRAISLNTASNDDSQSDTAPDPDVCAERHAVAGSTERRTDHGGVDRPAVVAPSVTASAGDKEGGRAARPSTARGFRGRSPDRPAGRAAEADHRNLVDAAT